MAFADLSTGIVTEPFFAADVLIHLEDHLISPKSYQNSSPTFYLIIKAIGDGYFGYFFNLTLLIITLMSIERWLHMSRRSMLTVRRLYGIIWVQCFLPISLVVYKLTVQYSPTFYFTNMSVILFCVSVTSVAYFKVFRIIRRHQQQVHVNESVQNFARPTINFKKIQEICVLNPLYSGYFYIGYLPVAITLGLALFDTKYCKIIGRSFFVSTVLMFLSSSLNPVLYLWRMKDIRNKVTKLVDKYSVETKNVTFL